jgi:hypothetical protein
VRGRPASSSLGHSGRETLWIVVGEDVRWSGRITGREWRMEGGGGERERGDANAVQQQCL